MENKFRHHHGPPKTVPRITGLETLFNRTMKWKLSWADVLRRRFLNKDNEKNNRKPIHQYTIQIAVIWYRAVFVVTRIHRNIIIWTFHWDSLGISLNVSEPGLRSKVTRFEFLNSRKDFIKYGSILLLNHCTVVTGYERVPINKIWQTKDVFFYILLFIIWYNIYNIKYLVF